MIPSYALKELQTSITEMESENRRMREVLEWYEYDETNIPLHHNMDDILGDGGSRAIEVLGYDPERHTGAEW